MLVTRHDPEQRCCYTEQMLAQTSRCLQPARICGRLTAHTARDCSMRRASASVQDWTSAGYSVAMCTTSSRSAAQMGARKAASSAYIHCGLGTLMLQVNK